MSEGAEPVNAGAIYGATRKGHEHRVAKRRRGLARAEILGHAGAVSAACARSKAVALRRRRLVCWPCGAWPVVVAEAGVLLLRRGFLGRESRCAS